ncbi:hypothetical protein SteCoe_35331 [Stentor coeruleus]|uniref:Uncharacterized protein n=1 Tax=Stentor coeruleus TaxID=5963 RepID=A0A1R2ASN2_9CILI|nr:hypothetical protein SteCoe_35331 [Stentor coeruleus]
MEEELERTLGEKGRELQAALEELRVKEFSYKVNELKSTLPLLGRCVICTLRLPCKHYSDASEMPSVSPISKDNFSVQAYTKNLDASDIMPKLPKAEPKEFSIRFRGRDNKYSIPIQERAVSLPNAQKLKLIEKIETYREEKIRKEIEKIQEMKEAEKRQKREMQTLEALRLKHVKKQKEKLDKYKEEIKARNEQLKNYFDEEEKKKRKDEEKRRKYIEIKKKELEEYYEKKKMMESISKQKVFDLEKEIVSSIRG